MEKEKNNSSNKYASAIQDEVKPFEYASAGVYHWVTVFLVRCFLGNPPILAMSYFVLHGRYIECMLMTEGIDAKKSGRCASFRNIYAMLFFPLAYLAVPVVHTAALAIRNYPAAGFSAPEYIPKAFCMYPWAILFIAGLVLIAARGEPALRQAFRRNALTSFYRVALCGDFIDFIRNRVQGQSESQVAVLAYEEKLQATA